MTRISPEFGDEVQAVWTVSADVSFQSNKFPKYKLGPDNEILEEIKEDSKGPPLKEVVVHESNQLTEQHKRLSVRDLASKFDKNLAAAAKLSEEAKLKEVPSLDGHVLLKKLRDALEYLKGRLAGRNKEDVEKAISMVEALAVQLTQKEGELIQEKFEVKKLVNFLKQASEDAKKLVNQEKSFACAEIESARAVVQRIGEALEEQERNQSSEKQQELEGLIEEVQEARRIKLMHQPRKVVDMEHELRELRLQIREKCTISVTLQNKLSMSMKTEDNTPRLYKLSGSEMLGSILRIQSCSDEAIELATCSIQWYRLSSQCSRREPILGANKCVYAPEPIDVGRVLQADIAANGLKVTVTTDGPIEQASDLGSYAETLLRKANHDFSVVISQMNGRNYSSQSAHLFHIGKTRIKLSRGWITKARESYSRSMQLCGFRGGGNSAAKSLFWQARKGQSFVLVFESERERNGVLILARKYAADCSSPPSEIENKKKKKKKKRFNISRRVLSMASRQVVQQQNRGEAVPGANKQKNNGAERKNRRALGDIGNLDTVRGVDGKPLPQVSRPITRSFCAQLLANAQAAAAENKKNSLATAAIVPDGAMPDKKAVARKPAQKKAATKPKPEEIIDTSPDTKEVAEKEEPKEKAAERSSRKNAPTLTSTLTARSKAACGLSNKPKDQIVDIDAADVNNDLAVVEYVEEMYKFYKAVENEGRAHDYMDSQPEINEKMRAILIDWLIQVHHKFELSPETLYLTINIVDRYLASKTTLRRELQLVGLSSMLIASKYEEIWAPEVNDLVCISDRTYSNEQILVMEKRILGELEWYLTVPTPYMFLVRFIKASMTDSNVENMAYFLAELGMVNYATLMYCPSMIAASAVYAARCTLNKAPFWNETLKLHTGFSEPQLMDCAKLLVKFHSMAADHKLRGAYRKYSSSERGAVALLPPAKALLAAADSLSS